MNSRAWCLAASLCATAASAQDRPAIADPHTAHRVEGRVLLPSGAPAVGVVVERTQTARGGAPYNPGFYRETTDARGEFRFFFSGLGFGSGTTWHLSFQRPRCPPTMVTLTLRRARVDAYWEGDVSVGNVIRLPACPR